MISENDDGLITCEKRNRIWNDDGRRVLSCAWLIFYWGHLSEYFIYIYGYKTFLEIHIQQGVPG